mmetsp:Transcript_25253/g.41550  ORF Transcript_25253/g.41550 Transcript_25253/m.41550 type:complete len:208 (-) Transcript_25253:3784-4407(-)
MAASASISTSDARSSLPRITLTIFMRFSASGRSTRKRLLNRLSTASSKSKGLFVAASTSTRSFSLVFSPSHMLMNSFLILRVASCSPCFSRLPSMLSTSSIKITAGEILEARVNTARTYFSPSPNHLEAIADMVILMKFAPASVATALANMVLPVPGGPNNRMPLHGLVRLPLRNNSGRCRGSITISLRDSFTLSSAPMSSKRTPMS